jgi:Uma2 family endonuclease
MTALMDEEIVVAQETLPTDDLDQVLWQAWKAMDLPEGYRAEIIEGSIEVSPTGRLRHALLANRLRRALDAHLADTPCVAYQDTKVIHGLKTTIPDVMAALEDPEEDPEGLGVDASGVALVVEVASPGTSDRKRDRVRKRRAYARAGIPVYVLLDDYDEGGTVVVLSDPDSAAAEYQGSHRYPYGTDAVIPEGPAKGFVIGDTITGGR